MTNKGRMDSVILKIEKKIKSFGRGRIFFADDFISMGSSANIRQSLLRISNAGVIIRVAKGIYCYPEIDTKLGLGVIYPSFDQIANAMAERVHARIVPTGEYALNTLGLSTQVPMNYVYYTDGQSRSVTVIGGKTITFKNTSPRNLAFTNKLSMLVTSALKAIKQKNVTPEQIAHISELLRKEDKEAVLKDLALMPVWIRQIVKQAYE